MYNYFDAMAEDIRNTIKWENIDVNSDDFDLDSFEGDCFVDDSITGNASGSYTMNTARAVEYVADNLDLLQEALSEFDGGDAEAYKRAIEDPEGADVTIRCYILSSVLHDVVDELQEEE